jgi:hypothetical protein
VKRDIFERSTIGAIFVNRQGAVSAQGTQYNRGQGSMLNLSDHDEVRTFLMGGVERVLWTTVYVHPIQTIASIAPRPHIDERLRSTGVIPF